MLSAGPAQDEWLKRVDGVLKVARLEDRLVQKRTDGLSTDPLYGRIAGPQTSRAIHAPWQQFMQIDLPDRTKALAQAKEDLANGADGLILASADLAAVLSSLPLHSFSLRNDAGDIGAEAIRRLVRSMPVDPARLEIDFGILDIGLVKSLHADGFSSPLMRADGRVGHAHGLTDVQELGAALAFALAHFRKLDFLPDAQLVRSVSMTLAASQDMFVTMAKIRAARILWAQILAACKLPDAPFVLHAETSRIMLAEVDAHTNILRNVAAVFGAGLGGATSICALPFSQRQGVPNAFARRVARNSQTILQQEAHLWRVDDPAAGAGYVESLTRQICEEAWAVMQAAENGDWPVADRDQAASLPVLGVSTHQPTIIYPAEIEVVS